MEFDDALTEVGEFGRYQICILLFSLLSDCVSGMINMGYVFLAYEPSYRCSIPTWHTNASNISSAITLANYRENLTRFYDTLSGSSESSSQCARHPGNSSLNLVIRGQSDALPCTQWSYSQNVVTNSVVTEWDLVCDNAWLAKNAATAYVAGMFVGGLLIGPLADRFGRRKILIFTVIFNLIIGPATAWAPNILVFAVMRFLQATTLNLLLTVLYVIVGEVTGRSWRTFTGSVFFMGWPAGCMLSGLCAYFVRDWSWLQLALTAPGVVFLIYIIIIPESPRWLLARGRHDETVQLLRRIGKFNGKELPPNIQIHFHQESEHIDVNCKDLLRVPVIRNRTIVLIIAWFSASFVYYGLTYNIGSLFGDIFLNVVISAILEIPTSLLSVIALRYLGRPRGICVMFIISGTLLLASSFFPKDLAIYATGVAIVGKLIAATVFIMLWACSPETFPTLVRATGLGVCNSAARVSGMMAPYVFLLAKFHKSIPLILFGGAGIGTGILALTLPETRGQPLPETIEDAVNLPRAPSIVPKCCARDRTEQADDEEEGVSLKSLPQNQNGHVC